MKLYAGNLPYDATEENLAQVFVAFGELHSITIPLDRETGRSRGIAFIEMVREKDGLAAIAELHQTDFGGRRMQVRQATERARVSCEFQKLEDREAENQESRWAS